MTNMTRRCYLPLSILLVLIHSACSFTFIRQQINGVRTNGFALSVSGSNSIEMLTCAGLTDDFENEGQLMAQSVAAWLDQEWMPQEVHMRMGQCAKGVLIQLLTDKNKETVEVADVMMGISDTLHGRWSEYNDESLCQRMGYWELLCRLFGESH